MTTKPNWLEIAERIEAGNVWIFLDVSHVLGLLGYETSASSSGVLCRMPGAIRWRDAPSLESADDAAAWLIDAPGDFDDLGLNTDRTWAVGYDHPTFGNDYGNAATLGRAMWAAFVRVIAQVERLDDD